MSKEILVSMQTSGWLNPMFTDARSKEAFEFIKKCGFDALDYNLDTKLVASQINKSEKGSFYTKSFEELEEYYAPIKAAAKETGIVFGQAHAPFPLYRRTDEDMSDFLIEAVEKCCFICNYLSIPALVVHPCTYLDKENQLKVNLAMYRKMIPFAKKYGVKLCLENMWTMYAGRPMMGACATAEEAVWYIDKLNEEAGEEVFGFCFDIGHATLVNAPIREYINTLGHRLTVLHLHDNDGLHDQHFAPMTQRKTDWTGLIDGLRDIGYRGTINFETAAAIMSNYPRELFPDMLEYIAEVGKYIREKVLEK